MRLAKEDFQVSCWQNSETNNGMSIDKKAKILTQCWAYFSLSFPGKHFKTYHGMDPCLCPVKGLFLIIVILLALFLVQFFKSCLPLDRDVKNLITDSIVLECLQLCPSPGVGIVPIFPLPWCIDITMFVTILLWHGMCPFLSFHCLD